MSSIHAYVKTLTDLASRSPRPQCRKPQQPILGEERRRSFGSNSNVLGPQVNSVLLKHKGFYGAFYMGIGSLRLFIHDYARSSVAPRNAEVLGS